MQSRTWYMWLLCGLVALGFFGAASGKLMGDAATIKAFDHFGYPQWFRVFVGVTELVGAIGLLIPAYTRLAAGGLSIIMVGAIGSHLTHDPINAILGAAVFLALLLTILFLDKRAQAS